MKSRTKTFKSGNMVTMRVAHDHLAVHK